jgi:hypothetical protein
VTDQPDQGFSHVHRIARIGDGPYVDAGQGVQGFRGNRLIGKELGRQSGLAKASRNQSGFSDRSADADPARDRRAERAHQSFDRFVCPKEVHMEGPILQPGWRWFTTNNHEDIHTESFTTSSCDRRIGLCLVSP